MKINIIKFKDIKFRGIENEIDKYFANHPFFEQDRTFAIFSILTQLELIARIRGYPEIRVDIINQFRRGVEKALYMIFDNCPNSAKGFENGVYDFIYGNQDKLISTHKDFLFSIAQYQTFETFCKLYSRGFADISIKKSKIKFLIKDKNELRTVVYEYQKMPIQNKNIRLDAWKYVPLYRYVKRDMIRITSNLNYWIHKTGFLPSQFKFSVEEVAADSFYVRSLLIRNRNISINYDFGKYELNDFRIFWEYVLLKIYLILHLPDPQLFLKLKYPFYYVQKKAEWIEEIANSTRLPINKVHKLIDDLAFDCRLQNVGARSQPFIPIENDYLILSPTLAAKYYYENHFLELQCKINKHNYDSFSTKKENILLSEIEPILSGWKSISYKSRIKIKLDGKYLTDIDLCIYDRNCNTLILIQIKWPIGGKSILDLHEKDSEVEQGIFQAQKSFNYVRNNMKEFVSNNFKQINKNRVKKIKNLIVLKETSGTTTKCIKKYPFLDYDIFKEFITKQKNDFTDIIKIAEKREFLPRYGKDFKLGYNNWDVLKYEINFPAIQNMKGPLP